MLPVKHAPHRATSNNVRGFRDIKHSTYSKRLFTGLGGKKKLKMFPATRPKFDGFSLGKFKLPGGYLEGKWLGLGLDKAATGLFAKLQSGGVLMGFVGNMLAAAYRPMRFGIINKLTSLLYLILLKVLAAINHIIWRIFFKPLIIIGILILVLLLIDFTAIFHWIAQLGSVVFHFFTDLFTRVFG